MGNVGIRNELNGIGAFSVVSFAALGKATKLHSCASLPERAIGALQKSPVLGRLAGVRVDGAVGKVGGWGKVDFQCVNCRAGGQVGLVESRAAAREGPGRGNWSRGGHGHPQNW